jgi:hypothetical protein
MLGRYFQQHKYLPTIHAGAAKGLAILNKYYSKTDESVMYRSTVSMFCQHFKFWLVSDLNFIVLY